MGQADFLKLGDWNMTCSMCGHKFKASQLSRNWQGMWRCSRCQEPRHPQDFVRGVKDEMGVPFSQPSTDTDIILCDLDGSSSYADAAIADCMIADRIVPVTFL